MNTTASMEAMGFRFRVPNRSQIVYAFQSLDELIPQDHIVRTVWDVANRLDLSGFVGDIQAVRGCPGRDATDPRLLVGLWLYATLDNVGSARQLDRLCRESDPYKWLCGEVSVNYHLLSDFRVAHAAALDDLLAQIVATLVEKGLVKVDRIAQDGLRVRASAGASSFRREETLEKLLEESRLHIEQLKKQHDDPADDRSKAQKSAQERAARERQERIEAAMAQLPELRAAQEQLKKKQTGEQKEKTKEPRVSTTDPEARRMKMSDSGFRPAVNVQVATDTESRAIVGVSVGNEGVDNKGQLGAMREQVQERSDGKVLEQLVDGGYLKLEDIETAAQEGTTVYVPPKPPRNTEKRGSEYDPRPTDSAELRAWRERMGSAAGQEIYKLRASTAETVNADLRCWRGLKPMVVRGLKKIGCVVLWSALAYNLLHFGKELIGQ